MTNNDINIVADKFIEYIGNENFYEGTYLELYINKVFVGPDKYYSKDYYTTFAKNNKSILIEYLGQIGMLEWLCKYFDHKIRTMTAIETAYEFVETIQNIPSDYSKLNGAINYYMSIEDITHDSNNFNKDVICPYSFMSYEDFVVLYNTITKDYADFMKLTKNKTLDKMFKDTKSFCKLLVHHTKSRSIDLLHAIASDSYIFQTLSVLMFVKSFNKENCEIIRNILNDKYPLSYYGFLGKEYSKTSDISTRMKLMYIFGDEDDHTILKFTLQSNENKSNTTTTVTAKNNTSSTSSSTTSSTVNKNNNSNNNKSNVTSSTNNNNKNVTQHTNNNNNKSNVLSSSNNNKNVTPHTNNNNSNNKSVPNSASKEYDEVLYKCAVM